jgi:outer membrane lipoprotein-sorting protein
MNRFFHIVLFMLALFCLEAAAAEPSIMALIRKQYNPNMTLQTQFDLDIFWSIREKTEHKSGSITIAPQNKFRVEINGELFISNGQQYWNYNKKVSQVTIDDVQNIDISSLPSQLLQTYLTQYTYVEKGSSGSDIILEWTKDSADKSVYTAIKIWANRSTGIISKLETTDRNSNISTYTFRKTIFGGKIPKGEFNFEVPKNAQVLNNHE